MYFLLLSFHNQGDTMKLAIKDITEKKRSAQKITMLTSYDFPTARFEEQCGVDILLVGDSVGTNMLGYESVTAVTIADMVHHVKAVAAGAQRSFVLCDMPFRSFDTEESALTNARLFIAAGADGVKMEGETAVLPSIRRVAHAGIPVCGHIGYTPQTSGVRAAVQGKDFNRAIELLTIARQIEEAGASLLVLELIPEELAGFITQEISIPTIGIGAGAQCDGQVQVINDILGLSTRTFRHAKAYDNLAIRYNAAISAYINEVKQSVFPTAKNASSLAEDIRSEIVAWIEKRHASDGLHGV
jgi:3-methyl-2-oxobutanoate hydroxymethyltransferase